MNTNYQPTFKCSIYATFSMLFIILFCSSSQSQIYSDDQLAEKGISSYAREDYPQAAIFLFAYIQRQPDAMTHDKKFALDVNNAYEHSLKVLNSNAYEHSLKNLNLPVSDSPKGSSDKSQFTEGRNTIDESKYRPPELKMPEKIQPVGNSLVLRGGGNIYFTYTPSSNFSSSPQIWITFERAVMDIVQPGQAAWVTRLMSSNEPNRLLLKDVGGRFAINWQNGKICGISSDMPYLNALQDPNQYVPFQVYNDGQGNFVVMKVEK